MGTLLGLVLAVLIVHSRTLDRSLFPWIIASQTVPVLAIAPIVIVALGSMGLTGVFPKSVISMYLCFFPVTVAHGQGPALARRDGAGADAHLCRQRRPHLLEAARAGFAALPVPVAARGHRRRRWSAPSSPSCPPARRPGLGARLLTGSYYGNTVQIWSALVMSALLGLALTGAVAWAEKWLTPGGRK